MATTVLQLLNRVLVKLGEQELSAAITEVTEPYHKLLLSFVNDIKEEIEDAHNWRALRQTLPVTISADAVSGTVTGADERSRLVRIYQQNRGGSIPLVFDVTDSTNPDPLIEVDLAELLYRDQIDPDTRQEPTYFALDNSSGDVLDLYVWPRPSSARTINVTLVVPQARIATTDLSDNIKIPIRPLLVGATWYAMEERGEELGPDSLFSEKRYQDALDSAIARDDSEQGNIHELIVT